MCEGAPGPYRWGGRDRRDGFPQAGHAPGWGGPAVLRHIGQDRQRRACGHKESNGHGTNGLSSQSCRFPASRSPRHVPPHAAQRQIPGHVPPLAPRPPGPHRPSRPPPPLSERGRVPRAHGHPLAGPAGPLRPLEQRLPPLVQNGVWERMLAAVAAAQADLAQVHLDSPTCAAMSVRAVRRPQALGRRPGGPHEIGLPLFRLCAGAPNSRQYPLSASAPSASTRHCQSYHRSPLLPGPALSRCQSSSARAAYTSSTTYSYRPTRNLSCAGTASR